jgi:hypothetical protein
MGNRVKCLYFDIFTALHSWKPLAYMSAHTFRMTNYLVVLDEIGIGGRTMEVEVINFFRYRSRMKSKSNLHQVR